MSGNNSILSPRAGLLPHGAQNNGFTWIVFEPLEIESQPVLARKGTGSMKPTGVQIKFLAPNELMEQMEHTWEDYESIGARLTQMVGEYSRAKAEAFGGGKGLLDLKTWKNLATGNATGAADNMISHLGGAPVFNYRVDTSLQYKASRRRTLDFQVMLAETGDPEEEVVKPVRLLQAYAAPTKQDDNITIKIPYAFKIRTVPGDLILFETAVIRQIAPTWKGPYIDGVPTSVQLQIGVEELSPLYDDQYTNSDRVKVRGISSKPSGEEKTMTFDSSPATAESDVTRKYDNARATAENAHNPLGGNKKAGGGEGYDDSAGAAPANKGEGFNITGGAGPQ